MRTYILILFITVIAKISLAQTNTFPPSGFVGIGTTSPTFNFQVNGTMTDEWNGVINSPNGQATYFAHGSGHGMAVTTGTNATSSAYIFHGVSNGISRLYVRADGNIGVGTSSPGVSMDVNGVVRSRLGAFQLNNGSITGGGLYFHKAITGAGSNLSPSLFSETGYGLYFMTNGSADVKAIITPSGDMGIGTASPDSKLAVKGKIHAQEVKVDVTAGADFVFDTDYKLKTLAETEQFIKDHKHLPEIPSARQMEEKGLEIGEMNIRLLQKVEELTLHLIQMNKMLQEQQSEIKVLKSKF